MVWYDIGYAKGRKKGYAMGFTGEYAKRYAQAFAQGYVEGRTERCIIIEELVLKARAEERLRVAKALGMTLTELEEIIRNY